MSDQLSMFDPMTWPDTHRPISSPGSADGPSPFASPDGPTTSPSGPEAAPASHSAPPASAKAPTTPDTSGLSSLASSASARLQSSLENRLRARMGATGSPEYALTWKAWPMRSGPPICALRARAPRTSDSGFGGWPTPTKGNADGVGVELVVVGAAHHSLPFGGPIQGAIASAKTASRLDQRSNVRAMKVRALLA